MIVNTGNITFQNINPDQLQIDSFRLAKKIYDDGLIPTKIIALWRGGTPIAMYIHEFFKYKGHNIDHIAIRTSSYVGTTQKDDIRVHGLEYIIKTVNNNDIVLIVDDIFDSGRTLDTVITNMKQKMRANCPSVLYTATLYYKPKNRKVNIIPTYYLHETDHWIVFPHELEDLSDEHIKLLKGNDIYNIIKN